MRLLFIVLAALMAAATVLPDEASARPNKVEVETRIVGITYLKFDDVPVGYNFVFLPPKSETLKQIFVPMDDLALQRVCTDSGKNTITWSISGGEDWYYTSNIKMIRITMEVYNQFEVPRHLHDSWLCAYTPR